MKDKMLVIDWGTTNLRAYLCNVDGAIVRTKRSSRGIKTLSREEYPGVLAELLSGMNVAGDETIFISGMAGSKNGWIEAPYCDVPCRIDHLYKGLITLPGDVKGYLIPGIKAVKDDHSSDVIRGEEIQIFGALEHMDIKSGLLCLPGTHSKWARVIDRTIVDFSTFMTGDVFQGLSQTILGCNNRDPYSPKAFLEGVSAADGIAGGLLHQLFTGRTRMLDGQLADSEVSSYISGLLIGHELNEATSYLTEQDTVVIIGSDHLCDRYLLALKEKDIKAVSLGSDIATCCGIAALQYIKGSKQ